MLTEIFKYDTMNMKFEVIFNENELRTKPIHLGQQIKEREKPQ